MFRNVIAALALITALGACATATDDAVSSGSALSADTEAADAASGLAAAPEQRFPDIPLPADVRENMERTFVYQAPGLEVGRMVYTSKATVQELSQFFIRELPALDWTLESVTQAENSVSLFFNKPEKRLEVTVSGQGIARSQEIVLHLKPVPNMDARP